MAVEDDALGPALVKLTDGRRQRLARLAGVVGEVAAVAGEEGRAVEGRISKEDVVDAT